MIDNLLLKTIRAMKRNNQSYRVTEKKACLRRIELDDNMRQRLSDSFTRVVSWQGNNINAFGIQLIWEGFVSHGHDQDRHIHYLIVSMPGFSPETAEEFDRVFFQGLEPRRVTE